MDFNPVTNMYFNHPMVNQPSQQQESPIEGSNMDMYYYHLNTNKYLENQYPNDSHLSLDANEGESIPFIDSIEKRESTKITTNHHMILNSLTKDNHHETVQSMKHSKKRKEVERKKYNDINENIRTLGELLPETLLEGKVNKGTILKGSVIYIKMLKDQLVKTKSRLDYLEHEIASLNFGI